jgi:hypothetical protein
LKTLSYRDKDISSVILNSIISDQTCLSLILRNSSFYTGIINNAKDDAHDLKETIKRLVVANETDELKSFANSIGIEIENNAP